MPKGGDLHNHFSGSVYAEAYWEQLFRNNLLIDTIAWVTARTKSQKDKRKGFVRMSVLNDKKKKRLHLYREKFLREWSIKNYNGGAPDDHFFATFGKFPDGSSCDKIQNLKELRDRALKENVQYIEIMLSSSRFDLAKEEAEKFNDAFVEYGKNKLDSLLKAHKEHYLLRPAFKDSVVRNVAMLETINDSVGAHARFMFRYLAFVRREAEAGEVFRNLLMAFEVADKSDLVVGVNFVEREDGRLSMKDYGLHMRMFKFFSKEYPNVKLTLHAGELTMGSVRPEDLRFHIQDAVFIAGADRIGHGVDIAYETRRDSTLRRMREDSIAVEINLVSNEFILNVKGDQHPLLIYREHKVPYVISTDDAGILRTDLTHQYVLLAQRYPDISYNEIKHVVFNSIEYSFLEESDKEKMRKLVNEEFVEFEGRVAKQIKSQVTKASI